MKLLRVIGGLGLCLALTSGVALADYQQGSDLTLSATAAPTVLNLSGTTTGTGSFALQEAVHNAITGSTGQSVDHYYVWIVVNGQPVLAIDPIWSGYSRRN
jgi:hypothetical protein